MLCNLLPHLRQLALCYTTCSTRQLATMLRNLFSHATYSHMKTVCHYAKQLFSHIESRLLNTQGNLFFSKATFSYILKKPGYYVPQLFSPKQLVTMLRNLLSHMNSWLLCYATCSHMQPTPTCEQLATMLCNCFHTLIVGYATEHVLTHIQVGYAT